MCCYYYDCPFRISAISAAITMSLITYYYS